MSNSQKQQKIFWIEVGKIKSNPMQPRYEFDEEKLRDLSESIREYGVLQPLIVTRKEIDLDTGRKVEYELIAGERRLRASKIAGLIQVPVIIRDDEGDKIKLELAIIENLQREDLNPLERAEAFKRLIEEFRLKHHEIGNKIGKSRVFVSNTLRLLNLPEEIKKGLRSGITTEGHVRALLMLVGREEEQMKAYQEILSRKLTVRDAERIARNIAQERVRRKDTLLDPETRMLEEQLSETLGTKVQIEKQGDKRRIQIDFFSDEELDSFLQKLSLERNREEIEREPVNEPIMPLESAEADDEEGLINRFTI